MAEEATTIVTIAKRVVACIAALSGLVVLAIVLGAVTSRVSLVLGVLAGGAVLVWTSLRQPRRLPRRAAAVYAVVVALAAVPVDVRGAMTGRLGVRVVPFVWGLPYGEDIRRMRAGEIVAPGCIVPPYPARYAVLLTW